MNPTDTLRLAVPIALVCTVGAACWWPQSGGQQGRSPKTLAAGEGLDETVSAELAARTTPVVQAVRKAAPSVVSIRTGRAVPSAPWAQQRRELTDGQGSGVIVDADGLVITNWHVVWNPQRGEQLLKVVLNDGKEFAAEVVNTAEKDDLALLRIKNPDGHPFVPITMGRSDALMIGETVLAIGNPYGQANTVTTGILSAIQREIAVPWPDGSPHRFTDLLQTDAAINPGNSGGALLDITGKLIGINNAIRTGSEGINYAIPVNRVRQVFEHDLLGTDGSGRLWLGMRTGPAQDAPGVAVLSVEGQSPAAQAGLRRGDRIVAVDGREVQGVVDFGKRLLSLEPGQKAGFRVARGTRTVDLELLLRSREESLMTRLVGMGVEAVTIDSDQRSLERASRAFARKLGRSQVQLLPVAYRVVRTDEDGPASQIGLQRGDILYATEGADQFGRRYLSPLPPSPMEWVKQLQAAGEAGSTFPAYVLRGNETLQGQLPVRASSH